MLEGLLIKRKFNMEFCIASLSILCPTILTLLLYAFKVIPQIWFTENKLQKQPIFWISITTPICLFLTLGFYFWSGLELTEGATKENIEIIIASSKIPLSFLSLAFPFGMLTVRMHQTTQVKHQIEVLESKNKFESYFKHREYLENSLEKRAQGYAQELGLKPKFESRPILNHNLYDLLYGGWKVKELFIADDDILNQTLVFIDKALRNVTLLSKTIEDNTPITDIHIQKCIETQEIIQNFSSYLFFHSIEGMSTDIGSIAFKEEGYTPKEFDLKRIIDCLVLIINIIGDAIELTYFTFEEEQAEYFHEKEVLLQNAAIGLKDNEHKP
jgi:hypothetical protein